MLTRIKGYSLNDIKNSIRQFLDDASGSSDVRALAVGIVSGNQDKIAAVHDWIKQNVSYISDPVSATGDIELFISPIRMTKDYNTGKALGGDCDDMSILATALYRSIGIRANVLLLDTGGMGLDHAVCKVYSEKLGHLMVDPSAPIPVGWSEQYFSEVEV